MTVNCLCVQRSNEIVVYISLFISLQFNCSVEEFKQKNEMQLFFLFPRFLLLLLLLQTFRSKFLICKLFHLRKRIIIDSHCSEWLNAINIFVEKENFSVHKKTKKKKRKENMMEQFKQKEEKKLRAMKFECIMQLIWNECIIKATPATALQFAILLCSMFNSYFFFCSVHLSTIYPRL